MNTSDVDPTMEAPHSPEIDRLSELANIGAGHAATALSHLAGTEVRMDVPHVRVLDAEGTHLNDRIGVFFELDGGLGAVLGIFFNESERDAVVSRLLGAPADDEQTASVLAEVGNILASHAASAIAETLGGSILPSIPRVALDGAGDELSSLAAERPGSHGIRIDCELRDAEGQIGGRLVLVPDQAA